MTKCECAPCVNRREWHRKNREKRKEYMRDYQRKRYAKKKNRYIPTTHKLRRRDMFGTTHNVATYKKVQMPKQVTLKRDLVGNVI